MMTQTTLFTTLFAIAGFTHADSTVIGAVETDADIYRADQRQSGLLNCQKMSAGSVD